MKSNIKLTLAYDGTNYYGWQKTKLKPSIEGTLENVLSKILQHEVVLQAASRTDRGVHAENQVANFFTEKSLDLKVFQRSLNQLLPKDIAVKAIQLAPLDFHPTLHCKSKEYHYHVCSGVFLPPMDRLYMWHYPHPLDMALMEEAAKLLTGKLDFQAFTNVKKNETYESFIRHVMSIKIVKLDNSCLRFEIVGENFLYKMVRNIIGSLVYIGCKKITLEDLQNIINLKKRDSATVTAPANGLKLIHVNYES